MGGAPARSAADPGAGAAAAATDSFPPSFNFVRNWGAPSRSACDVFSCALVSPTSNHKPLLVSFCKNRPGGF